MRIRLHGRLSDWFGAETEVAAPDGCTVAEVRGLLGSARPAASDTLRRSRACVGNHVVGETQRLVPEELIEFLPPVSGG